MICDSLTADPGLARGLANNQPAQDAAITSTTGRDDVSRVGRRLGDTNRTLAHPLHLSVATGPVLQT